MGLIVNALLAKVLHPTCVTEERKRDTDDRRQTNHHADIDEEMEEEDGGYTIAIDTAEQGALSFRQHDQAYQKEEEQP